jgi:putative membrane protein
MKTIIRHYIVDTVSLYLVSTFVTGIIFENGITTLLIAGFGLTVATLLIKPIINILLLPINLITFGLFKWISSVIALYLVTIVVAGFKISHFSYGGLTTKWLDIPAFGLDGFMAFIACSFVLSFISSFMYWLLKP